MNAPPKCPDGSGLAAIDANVSARVREILGPHPRCFWVCRIIAHAGDGFVCLVAFLIITLCVPNARQAIAQMLASSMLSAALVGLGKLTFRRPRPIPDERHQWSSLGKHDEHAFPSGHAARTASIATIASFFSPPLGIAAWAWSIAVSICRVVVGAHYGGDVIVGSLLGALSACLMRMTGWL